jgi:hypothetical protein
VRPADPDALALTPASPTRAGGDRVVAMLLDPRGVVHATTGLLPGKSLALPTQAWAPALQRLAVSFRTAPVLATGEVPTLPLPDEPGMRWTWLTRAERGWNAAPHIPTPGTVGVSLVGQHLEEGWLTLTPDKET